MKLTKKLVPVLCLLLLGCSGASLTAQWVEPEQADELLDVVSFDTGCPRQGVAIVQVEDGVFEVEACGRTERYVQTDSVFHSAETHL